MRRLDEPRSGPPDVSEGQGGGFALGMPVQCFNQQQKQWVEGIESWQQALKLTLLIYTFWMCGIFMDFWRKHRFSLVIFWDKVQFRWIFSKNSWQKVDSLKPEVTRRYQQLEGTYVQQASRSTEWFLRFQKNDSLFDSHL